MPGDDKKAMKVTHKTHKKVPRGDDSTCGAADEAGGRRGRHIDRNIDRHTDRHIDRPGDGEVDSLQEVPGLKRREKMSKVEREEYKILRMKAQEGILHTASFKTSDFEAQRLQAKRTKQEQRKTKGNEARADEQKRRVRVGKGAGGGAKGGGISGSRRIVLRRNWNLVLYLTTASVMRIWGGGKVLV